MHTTNYAFLRHVECCEHHLQGVNSGRVDAEKVDGFVCVYVYTNIYPGNSFDPLSGGLPLFTPWLLLYTNSAVIEEVKLPLCSKSNLCTDVKSLADEGQNKPPAPILTCMFTEAGTMILQTCVQK